MEAEAGRASIRLQLYGEAGSGTLILLQDTADLPVHWRWIEVALGTRHTNCQPFEGRFDPPAELVVHRPFFAAPIVGTTQDHRLFGLGVACELDLDALVDRAPAVRSGERRGELLQLRLRRPNDVASAGLAQPRQLAALAMPRSVIQTRPNTPCRASMVATIVCKVRESWVLPANTS